MKIVMIHGQNHKGSTWNIGNLLVQRIQGEKEVKEYFLPRDLNHFCTGCFACLEARERCPYWQEKAPIQQDLLDADLLIFTSPNYCMMPSAPMKAFLDLFFTNWMSHKPLPEMFSKGAVVISTAAGAGAKNTVKLIGNNLTNWGIPQVHSYAAVVNAMNWGMVPPRKKAKIEKDMDKLARKAVPQRQSSRRDQDPLSLLVLWRHAESRLGRVPGGKTILDRKRLAFRRQAMESISFVPQEIGA